MSQSSQAYFDFKQFRVHHDRCAQKVGTDGVLLGVWAEGSDSGRLLDIGTGTGLIALMLVQRFPHAQVDAVELDEVAAEQARENVRHSPFAARVSVHTADIRQFMPHTQYNAIVCNPPFYVEETLPPAGSRSLARHAAHLPFEELVASVTRLLTDAGCFSVVLPFSCRDSFTEICVRSGLSLQRECRVQTTSRKPVKRVLLTYIKGRGEAYQIETLVLQEGTQRSLAYRQLTEAFYL